MSSPGYKPIFIILINNFINNVKSFSFQFEHEDFVRASEYTLNLTTRILF